MQPDEPKYDLQKLLAVLADDDEEYYEDGTAPTPVPPLSNKKEGDTMQSATADAALWSAPDLDVIARVYLGLPPAIPDLQRLSWTITVITSPKSARTYIDFARLFHG